MNLKPFIISVAAALAAASGASAQSLRDLQDLFGRQQNRGQEKAVKVDYNIDFQYFFDLRSFGISDELFMSSRTYHVARFSPSASLIFDQNRNITHRAVVGLDITKDLGINPTSKVTYSEPEHQSSLRNTDLFKDIFFYYQVSARTGPGRLDFYAGIHPRSVLGGDYTRAIFADDVSYYDPNLEGMTLKFTAPKFSSELTFDVIGTKGVDRIGSEMAFTAGSYRPLDWLSLGWSGAYTHVSGNYLYECDVDNVLLNPYLKFDIGRFLHMQEFSLKVGPVASYQYDYSLQPSGDEEDGYAEYWESPRYPLGVEAILNIRHWNLGIENTFYYGDNLMPYRSSYYADITDAAYYVPALYNGEEFYFTRRNGPAWYDRVELYYNPLSTGFVSAKLSAVGHLIKPATDLGPFIGWQAKATLLFNLESFRHPREVSQSGNSRRRAAANSSDIPLISL